MKLFTELQDKHGWSIMGLGLPARDRTGLMFNFKNGTARQVRCAKLAVDADSALGLLLANLHLAKPAKSPRKSARRKSK